MICIFNSQPIAVNNCSYSCNLKLSLVILSDKFCWLWFVSFASFTWFVFVAIIAILSLFVYFIDFSLPLFYKFVLVLYSNVMVLSSSLMNFILISRFWIFRLFWWFWVVLLLCFSDFCLYIFTIFVRFFLCIFNLKVGFILRIFLVMGAIFLLILWWFLGILRSFSFDFYEVIIWAFP